MGSEMCIRDRNHLMRPFLLLFLLFPVLELFVFVKVAGSIGFFPALLLIILGSMFGVFVLRIAGLATALRARESLNAASYRPRPCSKA